MRRALVVAATIIAAIGCNQLLGNGNDFKKPPDAPVPIDGIDDACIGQGLPPTSISGTVYAPNGTLPIYNAAVYVPSAALAPIPDGVGSATCVSGAPIAITHSDAAGHFKLTSVPAGSVKLVVQVGKWRREDVTLTNVMACQDNVVAAADTRLPAKASEGTLPHIAITTGAADTVECIPRDVGVADSEIGTGSNFTGHVHLYRDNGVGSGVFDPATDLDVATTLAAYDIVMRGCVGMPLAPGSGAPAILQAWSDAGGWVFLEHYEAEWLVNAPAPWPGLATFGSATGGSGSGIESVDTASAIGQTFSQWLQTAGVSTTPGTFAILNPRTLCTALGSGVTRRLYLDPSLNGGLSDEQSFTYDNAGGGRVTFNDIHASGNATGSAVYPAECGVPYPQERALIFQLFETPTCTP